MRCERNGTAARRAANMTLALALVFAASSLVGVAAADDIDLLAAKELARVSDPAAASDLADAAPAASGMPLALPLSAVADADRVETQRVDFTDFESVWERYRELRPLNAEAALALLRKFVTERPQDDNVARATIEIARLEQDQFRHQVKRVNGKIATGLLDAYLKVADRHPGTEAGGQALYLSARLLENEIGDPARADMLYMRCAENYPGTGYGGESLLGAARLAKTKGDVDRALYLLDRAANDYEKFKIGLDARFAKLETLAADPSRKSEYQRELEGIVERFPENKRIAPVLATLADRKRQAGDDEGAVKALEDLGARFPETPEGKKAFLDAAALREENRDHEKAVALLERFLTLHANDPDAARVAFQAARIQDVDIRSLRKKRFENHAYFYVKRESAEAAVARYRKVAETYPESVYARRSLKRLGEIYSIEPMHDFETAKNTLQSLIDRYPESPEALDAKTMIGNLR